MKALEYFNATNLNVIPEQDFEELVEEVFTNISTNISKSLGPLGSSATILNGGLVEATKDGYSILKNYSFNNRYKKMIYNLIKAPCERMNNTVGDGTTTAITLTNSIFRAYKAKQAKIETLYKMPRDLSKAWDEVTSQLIDRIKKMAKPINPEDYNTIYNLAYVVSNGNETISRSIAETYQEAKSPAIKMKDSPTNKSYIKAVNGFEFPCNAIDPCYVRNQDLTATEEDVYTMIFEYTIDTDTFNNVIIPINDVMRARGNKMIIIAPAYDKYMCETVLGQYVNYEHQKYGSINLILTQYNQGKLSPFQRVDLAVVLKSKLITQELGAGLTAELTESGVDRIVEDILNTDGYKFTRCIGHAVSVLISCKNGSIFNPDSDIEDDEFYKQALATAQLELDDIINHTNYEQQSFASKIYDARARILQLQMKNYIYYVGADSELQKQILQDAIEDVIKCLRSATKHGVVPGCQISVIVAGRDYINSLNEELSMDAKESETKKLLLLKEIATIIVNACLEVYQQVLIGPNGSGIIKTIKGWEFTDPTDEGITSLKEEAVEKLTSIIRESVDKQQVWDIEKEELNSDIMTSAETDTMVLTSAVELIKILLSGNQCVFVDSDVTESHQETYEAYV